MFPGRGVEGLRGSRRQPLPLLSAADLEASPASRGFT